MLEITLPDPDKMARKRINRNPELSLDVIAQLKSEDIFGFGLTLADVNARLLAIALGSALKPPPRRVQIQI